MWTSFVQNYSYFSNPKQAVPRLLWNIIFRSIWMISYLLIRVALAEAPNTSIPIDCLLSTALFCQHFNTTSSKQTGNRELSKSLQINNFILKKQGGNDDVILFGWLWKCYLYFHFCYFILIYLKLRMLSFVGFVSNHTPHSNWSIFLIETNKV